MTQVGMGIGPPATPRPGAVLVIEDERPLREMFRRSLLFAGFHVLVAAGGREGLAILHSAPAIAVVTLDLNMPDVDGRKVRAEQRANERLAPNPHHRRHGPSADTA